MSGHILITGGAGFIGANAARYFSGRGWQVTLLDNLSRRGAAQNLEWLRSRINAAFIRADVRFQQEIEAAFAAQGGIDAVLHLAAQVAVTTSVADPRSDFEINALGTLNILEAMRRYCPEAVLLNASTNKVYGKMQEVQIELDAGRWRYAELADGVGETAALDFHSPYGCSKGAAERYVSDYSRIYGLRTVSFRQSCIYGPRQFGVEDQGWVAWFIIAALLGRPITIFGDGRQVRDVLHVDDLLRCYEAAIERGDAVAGLAFNIGGGPTHTLSLLELLQLIEARTGIALEPAFGDERPGDQKVYISDIRLAAERLEWCPEVAVEDGVGRLVEWVDANRELLAETI